MNNTLIVGKMCSGKSTAANILVNNYKYEKIGFAFVLKEIERLAEQRKKYLEEKTIKNYSLSEFLCDYNKPIFDCLSNKELEILEDICYRMLKIEREPIKPRLRYQFLGEEARKLIDNNIWVRLLKASLSPNVSYVIDDCRYLNEVESLSTWDIIKINISPEKQKERIINLYGDFNPNILFHESEIEVDKIEVLKEDEINGDINIKEFEYLIKEKIEKNEYDNERLKVYVAGPISFGDLEQNYLERKEIVKKLKLLGCKVYNPIENEPVFKTKKEIYDFMNTNNNGYNTFKNDILMINKSDVILIYEPVLSKGTSIEQGIARTKKPIIYVSNNEYLRNHPFVRYSSNWIFNDLEDAYMLIRSISSNDFKMSKSIKNLSFSMKNDRGII